MKICLFRRCLNNQTMEGDMSRYKPGKVKFHIVARPQWIRGDIRPGRVVAYAWVTR